MILKKTLPISLQIKDLQLFVIQLIKLFNVDENIMPINKALINISIEVNLIKILVNRLYFEANTLDKS